MVIAPTNFMYGGIQSERGSGPERTDDLCKVVIRAFRLRLDLESRGSRWAEEKKKEEVADLSNSPHV